MPLKPDVSPGTVSKILWHFTGGPKWNAKTNKQGARRKSARDAYNNLISILRTKQLRVGQYMEVIRAMAGRRLTPLKGKSFKVTFDAPVTLTSAAVCCLSDIPAPHLRYHSHRYGSFAVGFHRDAVIKAKFNPVLYALESTSIIRRLYFGYSAMDGSVFQHVQNALDTLEAEIDNTNADEFLFDVRFELDELEVSLVRAKRSLKDFLAFTKTFDESEFSTIYCEREWRSTETFSFKIDDIAMIVIPKKVGASKYYKPFVERVAKTIKLPRRIPIVPWDDLIEH